MAETKRPEARANAPWAARSAAPSQAKTEEPRSPRRVVVGIDGSDNAKHALRWAVDKVDVLGPVTPVSVYEPLRDGSSPDLASNRNQATALVRRAVEAADPDHRQPDLRGAGTVIEGLPGRGLVEAATGADLLVVGTRGQGGLGSTLLGSVSSYCATAAPTPVAIVPPDCAVDRPLLDVVVGVDGSPSADEALRWAIEHLASGGRIRAIGALPVWGRAEGPGVCLEQQIGDEVEAAVERVLQDHTIADRSDCEIVIVAKARDARLALREAADAGADLLVIGRRGLGRISFLMLGSVAAALAHHPTVPTVIIPSTSRPTNQPTDDDDEG